MAINWLRPTDEMLAGLSAGRAEMGREIENRDEEIALLTEELERIKASSECFRLAAEGFRAENARLKAELEKIEHAPLGAFVFPDDVDQLCQECKRKSEIARKAVKGIAHARD